MTAGLDVYMHTMHPVFTRSYLRSLGASGALQALLPKGAEKAFLGTRLWD